MRILAVFHRPEAIRAILKVYDTILTAIHR